MTARTENGDTGSVDERRLTFIYATQTGNAQDLAESLARHAVRQHFQTKCLSMDDYPLVFPLHSILTTDNRRTFQMSYVSSLL
jgi:sulfite reductase alpha subunit-like flavoprotein